MGICGLACSLPAPVTRPVPGSHSLSAAEAHVVAANIYSEIATALESTGALASTLVVTRSLRWDPSVEVLVRR